MDDLEAFRTGQRPDHVGIYLAAATLTDMGAIESFGERVEDGVMLVVDGDRGRAAFEKAVGEDPMAFARSAGSRDGSVSRDLTGGTCPDEDDPEDHAAHVIFAFVQEQLDEADGPYSDGDVMHAYVRCACGVEYSEKWLLD